MSRPAAVATALALVLAGAGAAAAQTITCPSGSRPVTEPQSGGGRTEFCRGQGPAASDGPMLWYYAGGQKQMEGEFRDGKPYGRWLGWYASGRPEGQAYFSACQLDGLVSWYEDGKVFYELDVTAGKAKIYDRNGREFSAEGLTLRHPPFVQNVLAMTFLLQKVCG